MSFYGLERDELRHYHRSPCIPASRCQAKAPVTTFPALASLLLLASESFTPDFDCWLTNFRLEVLCTDMMPTPRSLAPTQYVSHFTVPAAWVTDNGI